MNSISDESALWSAGSSAATSAHSPSEAHTVPSLLPPTGAARWHCLSSPPLLWSCSQQSGLVAAPGSPHHLHQVRTESASGEASPGLQCRNQQGHVGNSLVKESVMGQVASTAPWAKALCLRIVLRGGWNVQSGA